MAGEIGHMTVDPDGRAPCIYGHQGCLESLASANAIVAKARKKMNRGASSLIREMVGEVENMTIDTVLQAADKGDKLAQQLLGEAAKYISIAIVNCIRMFNPGTIIIGGSMVTPSNFLFSTIRQLVNEQPYVVPNKKIKIVPAKLGKDSCAIGAVSLVLKQLFESSLIEKFVGK